MSSLYSAIRRQSKLSEKYKRSSHCRSHGNKLSRFTYVTAEEHKANDADGQHIDDDIVASHEYVAMETNAENLKSRRVMGKRQISGDTISSGYSSEGCCNDLDLDNLQPMLQSSPLDSLAAADSAQQFEAAQGDGPERTHYAHQSVLPPARTADALQSRAQAGHFAHVVRRDSVAHCEIDSRRQTLTSAAGSDSLPLKRFDLAASHDIDNSMEGRIFNLFLEELTMDPQLTAPARCYRSHSMQNLNVDSFISEEDEMLNESALYLDKEDDDYFNMTSSESALSPSTTVCSVRTRRSTSSSDSGRATCSGNDDTDSLTSSPREHWPSPAEQSAYITDDVTINATSRFNESNLYESIMETTYEDLGIQAGRKQQQPALYQRLKQAMQRMKSKKSRCKEATHYENVCSERKIEVSPPLLPARDYTQPGVERVDGKAPLATDSNESLRHTSLSSTASTPPSSAAALHRQRTCAKRHVIRDTDIVDMTDYHVYTVADVLESFERLAGHLHTPKAAASKKQRGCKQSTTPQPPVSRPVQPAKPLHKDSTQWDSNHRNCANLSPAAAVQRHPLRQRAVPKPTEKENNRFMRVEPAQPLLRQSTKQTLKRPAPAVTAPVKPILKHHLAKHEKRLLKKEASPLITSDVTMTPCHPVVHSLRQTADSGLSQSSIVLSPGYYTDDDVLDTPAVSSAPASPAKRPIRPNRPPLLQLNGFQSSETSAFERVAPRRPAAMHCGTPLHPALQRQQLVRVTYC